MLDEISPLRTFIYVTHFPVNSNVTLILLLGSGREATTNSDLIVQNQPPHAELEHVVINKHNNSNGMDQQQWIKHINEVENDKKHRKGKC